jgi:hypothetical protein
MFPQYPNAALGAAVTFGLGTTFFPFATLLFDHNLTAVFYSRASVRFAPIARLPRDCSRALRP